MILDFFWFSGPRLPKLEKKKNKQSEKERREELVKVLYQVLENSTVMPFRWYGNKYMCFYCCSTFNEYLRLRKHTKEEHEGAKLPGVLRNVSGRSSVKVDVSELACKKCPKEMINFQYLIEHLIESHNARFDLDISQLVIPFKLSDGPMTCLQCGDRFRFFGPLLGHTHKVHSNLKLYLCEVCGQGFFSKLNVSSHIKTAHPGNINCDLCDRIFPSYYSLRKHYDSEHQKDKLKCSKCPEVLGSIYLKKRHLALVHDVKSEQFYCEICSKLFTLKYKLESHKRRVHLKERLITCEICGFKVFDNHQLKTHMIRHTKTRPFQCEFCKKSFQRKKTWDFHRRIHTNDRRYSCTHCGRAFVQSASLKLHTRVHHTSVDQVHNENDNSIS